MCKDLEKFPEGKREISAVWFCDILFAWRHTYQ